ncbi:hypothetical protein V2J09_005549 [Rumex salicifolius]
MEYAEDVGIVTPGDVLGKASELRPGKGAYVEPHSNLVYASLTGCRSIVSPHPDSTDKRPIVEITGHKAHGAVPEPGCTVLARIKRVSPKIANADIMCVGPKALREKFTGIIRQQDVRETQIDKVDMHASFHAGDTVRAVTISQLKNIAYRTYSSISLTCSPVKLSLGDARAYYLSTAKNELGVVSAQSAAGGNMVPISWTEMQCPLTGQIEQRKVAKAGCGVLEV